MYRESSLIMEDPSSLSNFTEVAITHASFSLSPDFSAKTIQGTATYTFSAKIPSLSTILLDCKKVQILSVTPSAGWELGPPNEVLGTGLKISLEPPVPLGHSFTLAIEFCTTEECTAVQFLDPPQTAGKSFPYCYTQCEPIHCRTLVPIQDTPAIRFPVTYSFSVQEPLKVAVGGIFQDSTLTYEQRIPIPSYLIAFAVGNIEKAQIGPRSWLFTEPEMLESGVYEFGLTEEQLQAAEKLMGEYSWGELNILLLPPSFPYGGMENPNLIFVTPSLLAGDRSLTSVVVHEISHSWTGNTVTNANWEHFWINEGFTVFFERKIVKELYGEGLASLQGTNGLKTLENTVKLLGEDSNFTRLNVSLAGIDPDDAFSAIPYEKGCLFLTYLESLTGEDQFMGFLKEYLGSFQYKSVTSYDFKDFFISRFPGVEGVDWAFWLRGTGNPGFTPAFDRSLIVQVESLFSAWQEPSYSPSLADIESFAYEQVVLLLSLMSSDPKEHYGKVAEAYCFAGTSNAEIKFNWLILVLKLGTRQHYPKVKEFLEGIGRMKYVRPLFRLLVRSGQTALAGEILANCREFYHPTLVSLLKKELDLD